MKQINGDNPGNIFNRLLYFYQCIKNHKNKNFKESYNIIEPRLSIKHLKTFNKSPSRLLCDGLWNTIDYENLTSQFGSKLYFFDIGCGSGLYGKLVEKFSSNNFGNYTGLDIYKNENYPMNLFIFKIKQKMFFNTSIRI